MVLYYNLVLFRMWAGARPRFVGFSAENESNRFSAWKIKSRCFRINCLPAFESRTDWKENTTILPNYDDCFPKAISHCFRGVDCLVRPESAYLFIHLSSCICGSGEMRLGRLPASRRQLLAPPAGLVLIIRVSFVCRRKTPREPRNGMLGFSLQNRAGKCKLHDEI